MEVGIRALKQNASQVVSAAAAGESITITDRGRPVARLTPLEQSLLDRLIASGAARAPLHALADLPAPQLEADLSSVLRDMRDDERY
ncbi:prevent-host-death family protein [Branchiibius hedensis]|uniref:Antitoxin n=1 Tax=Branchiibius hedensis TaxID=672460 RepID=A0A2Y9C1N1_9MICO|nr:type II toxin-antitoxin system prevent-host-death family antitoxin [Branchiibius hedensis]PWJ25810.1 prevent-host-death family protein [Branchiibius hedensis]SSA34623.1 prevent-host-death family protein [Branchiibius hedensis]